MMRNVTLFLSLLTLGCGGPTMSVLPVSGTVTLDGQPVEQASLAFIPEQGQPLPASGLTDAAGHFVAKTIEGPYELQGALPGRYKVVVTKCKYHGIAADEQGLSGSVAASGLKIEWLTPQKYADKSTTDLTCQVEPNMQPMKIELKSK